MFIGRTDIEAEAPILWPNIAKSQLIGKDPDTRKDRRQEEKGVTGNEMVGWHHRHDGHEFEQAWGVGDGQGRLACCSPRGRKESGMTEQLNSTEFSLVCGPNIPGSYAILLFTALDFTFITSHIHNWVLFLLWLRLFILSGVISPLFSSIICGTYGPGSLSFSVIYHPSTENWIKDLLSMV